MTKFLGGDVKLLALPLHHAQSATLQVRNIELEESGAQKLPFHKCLGP